MHPSSLLFAIALACTAVLTHASALPAEDIALTPRDASPLADELDKRQCTPGCNCYVGTPQGQYCGSCGTVIGCTSSSNRCWTDVYECNPRGGCCRYGHRNSCPGGPCGP